MQWADVRRHFPHQWLVVEALEARSESGERVIEQLSVVDTYPDGAAVMKGYAELRRRFPQREFLFVHTAREELDITELRWVGIRPLPGRSG